VEFCQSCNNGSLNTVQAYVIFVDVRGHYPPRVG